MNRPSRAQLLGHSPSEFKTILRRLGHKVPRDFFGMGCISRKGDRQYRWRWWANEGFIVDIGEPDHLFDRWGNSVEMSVFAYLYFETPNPPEAT